MEKGFEVFISFKNTDKNGERTQESFMAEELYEALKATGGEESVSLSVKCSVRLENSGFSDERIRE